MQEELIPRNRQKLLMNVRENSDTGCWEWQGQVSHAGYGRILLKDEHGNKMHSAHRASYEIFVGPISKDGIIVQTCGNRMCVNPKHLREILPGSADTQPRSNQQQADSNRQV